MSRAPVPLEPPKPGAASCTTQLNDTIPERWIQAKSPTEEGRGHPSVIVPGQEWRRAGAMAPGPCHGTRSEEAIRLRGVLLER